MTYTLAPGAGDVPFVATPLDPGLARRAFVLLALERPGARLAPWLRRARQAMRSRQERRGIRALIDERGCVHGVFSYRVDRRRRTLVVREVMLAGLPGHAVAPAFTHAAAALAKELTCGTLLVEIDGEDRRLDPRRAALDLIGCGFRPATLALAIE